MMEKCYDEGTLQAFLDNELAPEMSQAVARHLVDCDPCAILLAEVEEETAFAFSSLEQEFNTLVPTQRLWTKINESIEVQHRKRSLWQYILTFVSGLSFTNPHIIAFGSLLLLVGVVSALIVVKNEKNSGEVAFVAPPFIEQTAPKVTIQQPINSPTQNDPPVTDIKEPKTRTPQIRVEKADFRREERVFKTDSETIVKPIVEPPPPTPKYLDGEESYVKTISRLEKTVDEKKDEVLKPSARFSYEKDLAVVNDTISKMQKEARKNPKNEDAKQILFASYQNKIELLNSVTQRGELMAKLR